MVEIFDFIIANLPLIVIAIGVIVAFVWLISKVLGSNKPFKYLEMKKAVREDFDKLYKNFSENTNKPIYIGITRIGFALGYVQIYWNRKLKMQQNLNPENIKVVVDGIRDKKGKFREETVPMKIFKICSSQFPKKQLAMLLGSGINYFIVDDSLISDSDYGLVIEPNCTPSGFYDVTLFSRTARRFIENVSFRINRENELQEFANQIPKMAYFENRIANYVAKIREQAYIEKEKYKAQTDNAED